MKILIGAIALTLAVPAFAQGAPAAQPAPAPEAKQGCCAKMKAEGKECCCKDMAHKDGAKGHGERGEHSPKAGGEQGHQH